MLPYNDYNSYLRKKFGSKVYKISLDAGFTCPNRDGTKGKEGCTYCNALGSRAGYVNPSLSVEEQLSNRIALLEAKYGAKKFIAYFQAFTNTYAPLEVLKKTYDAIRTFQNIVGISIGTRPDCVNPEILGLIASFCDNYETWIEYGLQSTHDKTLERINRGHNFADFKKAVTITREACNIKICAHVILGLPGETKAHMLETAKTLSAMKIDGIKIHLMHILKGSAFEDLYKRGEISVMEREEYVNLVCDFLEILDPDIIIQRITGEGDRKNHIAPVWALDKTGTINSIRAELKKRGSRQGFKLQSRP